MLKIHTLTTPLGNRAHTLKTGTSAIAYAVYERALNIGLEPELNLKRGAFTLEFVGTDAELSELVSWARQQCAAGVA